MTLKIGACTCFIHQTLAEQLYRDKGLYMGLLLLLAIIYVFTLKLLQYIPRNYIGRDHIVVLLFLLQIFLRDFLSIKPINNNTEQHQQQETL